ncbi:carboxypeptidase-like regulatory domain-containing protein [Aquimarina sp. 2201CG14-23]|uniref:carboxypeptidase-like regulatory domain-containing protein n=1 Tax=Aquimarina mycalae TaxID=3040073 RepID=UPI002477DA3A|nr:carboxypeptidase-like regulatory domain-containing protein [Aquimarina sp. 2201CG14-23]MDH7447290.1 carboxypeptidase-like regulatory domain-containing protein [Aquimarina sp. 2201CG14-23]
MKIYKILLLILCVCLNFFSVTGQTISSKVVDKKTNEVIPYATIQIGENQGIVTNEEGRFSITLDEIQSKIDSIYISSMGYATVGVAVQNITDSIIYIEPKAIELKSVFISNKNLTIDEIIDNVDDNMEENYRDALAKSRLFFRETNTSFIKKMDIKFKKSSIAEIDKNLVDSISRVVPRNSVFYAEALCDFYGNTEKQKLNVIKGARLYDKNNGGSFEAIFKKMEKIFRDNVKPDSYIKIRSGLFSQKVQVDSILNANEDAAAIADGIENPKENFFFKSRKMNLKNLFNETFYQSDTKLNVIKNSGRYNFERVDYTILDDIGVYVINFTPKRRGDFKGTIYVNTEDFAIMRIDYQNVKRLRSFNLLGLSFEENGYSGTTIFAKGPDGKYGVKFIEKVTENKFGVDRPLSIIEKNKNVKGRNKQNQLSLNLDVISYAKNKYEVIVFNATNITESEYASSKENKNVDSAYLSKYDPDFWKGYNIIEPNTAIKQFKVIEEQIEE